MNKCWSWIHSFLAISLVLITRFFQRMLVSLSLFHRPSMSQPLAFTPLLNPKELLLLFSFSISGSLICVCIPPLFPVCRRMWSKKSFIYFLPKTEPEKQINKHQKGTSWPQLHYTDTPVQRKLNKSTFIGDIRTKGVMWLCVASASQSMAEIRPQHMVSKTCWIFWLVVVLQRTNQKIKKYSKKFYYPRVSPGDQPLTKSWRNSGLEIESEQARDFVRLEAEF